MMKVAVATDDGKTISRHFGRAPYYLVFTIDDAELVSKEIRIKPDGRQFTHRIHQHHSEGSGHGFGTCALTRRTQMIDAIRDCDAIVVADVICGTYLEMTEIIIRPFVTEREDAEQAVRDFIDGQLDEYTEWLH